MTKKLGGTVMAEKSFWGGLFDMSFQEFVTIRVIKVLFILAIIGSAIAAIAMLIGGFAAFRFGAVRALLMIIGSPVLFFVYVLLARIWLEIVVVVFRISENTSTLVEQGKQQ
jgi:hypothetical protein